MLCISGDVAVLVLECELCPPDPLSPCVVFGVRCRGGTLLAALCEAEV